VFTSDKVNKLNPIELDIYLYLQDHPDELEGMKIRELAAKLHVSTATILRFCKKFDCSGFVEFKIKFKDNQTSSGSTSLITDQPVNNSYDRYFKFSTIDGVTQFENQILNAADLIKSAQRVIFIGEGSSGVMAKYGSLFLTTMGKSAQYYDSIFVPIPVEDHSNTIVVAISISGETLPLIDRLEGFKSLGAKIITITNGKLNTVASLAEVSLYYEIPKEEFMVIGQKKAVIKINGTSHVPTLYLIESIGRASACDDRQFI